MLHYVTRAGCRRHWAHIPKRLATCGMSHAPPNDLTDACCLDVGCSVALSYVVRFLSLGRIVLRSDTSFQPNHEPNQPNEPNSTRSTTRVQFLRVLRLSNVLVGPLSDQSPTKIGNFDNPHLQANQCGSHPAIFRLVIAAKTPPKEVVAAASRDALWIGHGIDFLGLCTSTQQTHSARFSPRNSWGAGCSRILGRILCGILGGGHCREARRGHGGT